MNVIVDGEPGFQVQGDPPDVLAVLAEVDGFLREKGRAIVSLVMDGEDIRAERARDLLHGKSLDTVGTLEVRSEAVAKLVEECLNELDAAVPELPVACRSLAAVFQGEHPENGFEPFHELATIWQTIKTRERMVVNALNLSLDDLVVDGVSGITLHEEFNRHLEEAAEALQAGDCILLGDLLEYELAPRAELEAGIVAALKEQLPKRCPPS